MWRLEFIMSFSLPYPCFIGCTIKWRRKLPSKKEWYLVICSKFCEVSSAVWFRQPLLRLSCSPSFRVRSLLIWKPSQMAEPLPITPSGVPLANHWLVRRKKQQFSRFRMEKPLLQFTFQSCLGGSGWSQTSKLLSRSGFSCSVLLTHSPRSFSWEHALSKSFAKEFLS